MKPYRSYISIHRYFFLFGPILGTLIQLPVNIYPSFILLSLLLVINAQSRKIYENKLWLITSMLIELPLVLAVHTTYKGFLFLVLFVGLIDAFIKLRSESYILGFYIFGGYLYCLYSTQPLEWIWIYSFFYITHILLLLQIQTELSLRADTESLYDQIRMNNYQLEAAQARLIEYSKQVEHISQLEERNRISRDLHDSIGHRLTGVLYQVDAAIQLMDVDKEKGMDLLHKVYENIHHSMEEVRQTVQKLRPPIYQSHMASLRELINNYQRDTGVHIVFSTEGTPYGLFPSIEITLYRNIQEALTNAVRHGGAKNIQISMIYGPNALELSISDDGIGAPQFTKGFGLSGMIERVELVDGRISFTGSNGFCIHMWIPRREL